MAFVIALDGFAATGKHTLGTALCRLYGLAYLDTGAIYRTLAYQVLQAGLDPHDEVAATQMAKHLDPQAVYALQNDKVIRTNEVGIATSVVAAFPGVRAALLDCQRQVALYPTDGQGNPLRGALLDGRDIGTVICPEAPVKLFLTASVEIRAQRRFKELQNTQKDVILQDVLTAMQERDARDAARSVAPTKPASDAVVIDTSALTPTGVLVAALQVIDKCGFSLSP